MFLTKKQNRPYMWGLFPFGEKLGRSQPLKSALHDERPHSLLWQKQGKRVFASLQLPHLPLELLSAWGLPFQ